MREINAKDITEQVKRLCMEANSYLPEDIKERINKSEQEEPWALAKNILGIIHENYLIAEENYVPVCQDTGMACVFMEIGQDVTSTATWKRRSTRAFARATPRAACANRLSAIRSTASTPPTTPQR